MLAVHPVMTELSSRHTLHDGAIVVVVPVDVIDASTVDVDLVAQHAGDHRRVLNVPRRSATAEAGVPGEPVVLEVAVPEDEVAEVPAQPLVGIARESVAPFGPPAHIEAEHLTEALEGKGIVIDVAVVVIGVTPLNECFYDVHGLLDRRGGAGYLAVGELDAEPACGIEKLVNDRLGELGQGLATLFGLFDGLVFHVGEVYAPLHVISPVLEVTLQHILEEEGAIVPQMLPSIHRRPAGEQADRVCGARDEGFASCGECVVKRQGIGLRHLSSSFRPVSCLSTTSPIAASAATDHSRNAAYIVAFQEGGCI